MRTPRNSRDPRRALRTAAAALAVAAAAGACATHGPDVSPEGAPSGEDAAQRAEPAAPRTEPVHPPLPELPRLWNWNDPAASERAFRDAAAQAAARGARSYETEAWTQVARAQALQKKYDDAHATLAAVQPALRADEPVPSVRWNLEKGRTLRSSGKPKESEPYFLAAWKLANEAGHVGLALDAAHMMALALEPDRPDEALGWAHRAIDFAEASQDPRAKGWLGPLYNNTGWTHFGRGEHAQALALWEKGVAVREAAGETGDTLRIGRWTVARGLRALGRHAEAVSILERLRDACDAAGSPDGYVFEELAENALAQGREDDARADFLRAFELLRDEEDVKSDAKRLERLRTAAGLAR